MVLMYSFVDSPLVPPAAELLRQSRLLGMQRSAVHPTGLLSVPSWLPPARLPHEYAEIPQSSSCTSTALILATLVHHTASFQIAEHAISPLMPPLQPRGNMPSQCTCILMHMRQVNSETSSLQTPCRGLGQLQFPEEPLGKEWTSGPRKEEHLTDVLMGAGWKEARTSSSSRSGSHSGTS